MGKLGVYWSVMHRRPQDYAYFKKLKPTVMKVMDGGDVDYKWIRENLPLSLVVARIHALSEQHEDMLRAPEETGRRHAKEWNDHQKRLGFHKENTLILGINEPRVWEAGVSEALRIYTIALCDEAAALYNMRVGAMQLGVGWPNNKGDGTPPDWSPFHGVEDAMKRGDHALVLHEYWADHTCKENWGWWAGRALKCPWRVPIIVGECGIDMYVKDASTPHNKRGWLGKKSPQQYAAELAEYTSLMSADNRFAGNAVFASDFASDEWYSFDIEPAYDAILATSIPVPIPTPPQYGSRDLVHPLPGSILTQHWGQNGDAYSQYGLWGHNGTDMGGKPLRTPVRSMAAGVVSWSDLDANYGNYVRVDHKELGCYSFYAHLDAPGLMAGTPVNAGTTIGLLGSSGNSTGPHLHFEIRLQDKDGAYKAGTPMEKGRADPETWCILRGLKL